MQFRRHPPDPLHSAPKTPRDFPGCNRYPSLTRSVVKPAIILWTNRIYLRAFQLHRIRSPLSVNIEHEKRSVILLSTEGNTFHCAVIPNLTNAENQLNVPPEPDSS